METKLKATPGPWVLLDTMGRRNNRKFADKSCLHCGATFRPIRESSKYCGRNCAWANNGGHNRKNESWWTNSRGYVEGRIFENGVRRRIKQHRYIMELHIGRRLHPEENVHHINGIKTDNRIENLELIGHGEHSREHNKTRIYKKGYSLNLSQEERKARADRISKRHAQKALAKARGES